MQAAAEGVTNELLSFCETNEKLCTFCQKCGIIKIIKKIREVKKSRKSVPIERVPLSFVNGLNERKQ